MVRCFSGDGRAKKLRTETVMRKHLQCLVFILAASCLALSTNARAQPSGVNCFALPTKQEIRHCLSGRPPGGQPQASKEAPQAGRRGSCAKLPGVWEWFMNGDVRIKPDGTASQPSTAFAGTWTCSNGQVVIRWNQFGLTDTLKLSSDGNHLTGSNGISAVWGNRR